MLISFHCSIIFLHKIYLSGNIIPITRWLDWSEVSESRDFIALPIIVSPGTEHIVDAPGMFVEWRGECLTVKTLWKLPIAQWKFILMSLMNRDQLQRRQVICLGSPRARIWILVSWVPGRAVPSSPGVRAFCSAHSLSAPWEAGSLWQVLPLSYCCLASGAFCREAHRVHLKRSRWHLWGSGFRSTWLGCIEWKGKCVPVHGAEEGVPAGPEDLETKEGKSLSPPGGGAQARTARDWHPPFAVCGPPTAKGMDIMSSESTVPGTQPHCLPGSAVTPVHRGTALCLGMLSIHVPWLLAASAGQNWVQILAFAVFLGWSLFHCAPPCLQVNKERH